MDSNTPAPAQAPQKEPYPAPAELQQQAIEDFIRKTSEVWVAEKAFDKWNNEAVFRVKLAFPQTIAVDLYDPFPLSTQMILDIVRPHLRHPFIVMEDTSPEGLMLLNKGQVLVAIYKVWTPAEH